MRGKFVKPPLKRVPRYEAKIARMLLNARKEIGFTVTLKSVRKDQFRVDEPKDNKNEQPEWSWKKSMAAGDEDQQQQTGSGGSKANLSSSAASAGASPVPDDED